MAVRYFRYFPDITYNGYAVKDITKLASFRTEVENTRLTYLPYTVREEESAQDVAQFYYGDVSYVWLVYLSNQMVDPYFDWPMTQMQLDDYITDQYLYACATCTLKREPETLELLSEVMSVTADMMLAISRGLPDSTFDFLNESSEEWNQNYHEIWHWLEDNSNLGLPGFITDEYGIENYIAIQETLQEIIDSEFDENYVSQRPRLYADLINPETNYWNINGDGVLDSRDLEDVQKFALGQYDDIRPSDLAKVRASISALSEKWLSYRSPTDPDADPIKKPYSMDGEAEIFRLGRPMEYSYVYDYLNANITDPLADIIIKIPNIEELKKTLNVIEWTQDATLTKNIIHYQNIDDPTQKISADTYALNSLTTANDWSEFLATEWEPVRIYDYEFLQNEEKRTIKLVGNNFARQVEDTLKGIIRQ